MMLNYLKIFLLTTFTSSLLIFSKALINPKPAEAVNLNNSIKTCQVPIIMYHRVSVTLPKNRFKISPLDLETDLLYLKRHGYQTIVMQDLIDYAYNEIPLPAKPILLTFDDGNYSDYKYLYPLLKKYKMKAVISIIGKPTEIYSNEERQDINYPNLTWRQIKEMLSDNVIEVQNHSYNLHGKNGSQKLKCETKEQYQKKLFQDLQELQTLIFENTGFKATTFTYPLGKLSEESFEVLQNLNLSASLTCSEGLNVLTPGEKESLFWLNRCIRTPEISVERIIKKYNLD